MDVVVSFETLEHLSEQEAMLSEIRRVLRQDGLLIISTPNKPLYSRQGDNPFHVKELCREEFVALLKSRFAHVSLLGQKVMYGSLLSGTAARPYCSANGKKTALWSVCLLRNRSDISQPLPGNGPLPPTQSSFFDYPLEKSDLAAQLRENLAELQERHDAAQARLEAVEAAYTAILASRSCAPRRRCVACGIFSREKGTKAESETPWWGQ